MSAADSITWSASEKCTRFTVWPSRLRPFANSKIAFTPPTGRVPVDTQNVTITRFHLPAPMRDRRLPRG